MCHQDSQVRLSPEENDAAEESLTAYCKPVELYNILQLRAARDPSFLPRCLSYKVEANQKKRKQLTVIFPENVIRGQTQNILPLYVTLARQVTDIAVTEHSAVYRLGRGCVITDCTESGRNDRVEANLVLPDLKKISLKSRSILFVSCDAGQKNSSSIEEGLDKKHLAKVGGYCLWGEIPVESLHFPWDETVKFNLGHKFETPSTVVMRSSFVEPSYLNKGSRISFPVPHSSETMEVQVNISAQEVGARERSAYNSYSYENVPMSSLARIFRLRTGNVVFNYKYYNNKSMKTEVTEDFSCPFCLLKCASFGGLRSHLLASHDLFNFEFWESDEFQAVNISLRTDIWTPEMTADGVDLKSEPFEFCSKPRRRRISMNSSQNEIHVHPHILKLGSPEGDGVGTNEVFMDEDAEMSLPAMPVESPMDVEPTCHLSNQKLQKGAPSSNGRQKISKPFLGKNDLPSGRHNAGDNGSETSSASELMEHDASNPNSTGVSNPNCTGVSTGTAKSSKGPECPQSVGGNNLTPSATLQFAKTRKLSSERSDPRNRAMLQKRQFFHSHRAQPMAMEQVLSDRDSEDEIDDEVADFEDRRMLDDFVDVTKDETRIMHLWNSFTRKQRVLADGHIPWACEAFSRLHGRYLVQSPQLSWCWRLFMIKLWNHSLLDGRTMDNCNTILRGYQQENSDAS
uniref:Polycomb group protein EMF2 n=1 Tax=Eschscholzia californica TaxID=3467 RepID=Q1W620_ESCCA|nr:polycomb group protein EMF2 [Eschscholzia californica]